MIDHVQLDVYGEETYPDIEFDCPLCDKHIIVERDEKGNYFHRSWMFHFTYEHAEEALKHSRDNIGIWLYYFCAHDNVKKELIDEWNKTKESKQ